MFNVDALMEIRRTIQQLYTTSHQQGRSEQFTVAILPLPSDRYMNA